MPTSGGIQPRWRCRCLRCDKVVHSIRAKIVHKKSCGCHREQDLIGRRFARLTVTGRADLDAGGHQRWYCICDCGKKRIAVSGGLLHGKTRSCGCGKERGLGNALYKKYDGSREASCFQSMHHRCSPKGASWKGSAWKHYGGRGIRVCERWSLDADGFKNFLADMGRRPSLKHSIERNDVNGNYEPANCHWATRREQTRNTRRTIRIVVEGREVLLVDEVRARGLDYTTVFRRLQRGWDDARALTTPGRKAADAHPLPDARRQHRPGAGT